MQHIKKMIIPESFAMDIDVLGKNIKTTACDLMVA